MNYLFPEIEGQDNDQEKREIQKRKRENVLRRKVSHFLHKPRKKKKAPPAHKVKEKVRERDGYRCRDCGISEKDHIAQTGRTLDVHRLFPGQEYEVGECVSLCRACHGKKKGRESEDLLSLFWNFYNPADLQFLKALIEESKRQKVYFSKVLDAYLAKFPKAQPTAVARGGDCRP